MLYTGTGDDGKTKAFGCDQQRISKSSEFPEAIGALDELNTFLGLVKIRVAENKRITNIIREVQETLFIIQAEVAGANKKINKSSVQHIEDMINIMEKEIPSIKGFSIAGGTEASALLDIARTSVRHTERRLISAIEAGVCIVTPETRVYINRLSSLFFVLARLANHTVGITEESPHY